MKVDGRKLPKSWIFFCGAMMFFHGSGDGHRSFPRWYTLPKTSISFENRPGPQKEIRIASRLPNHQFSRGITWIYVKIQGGSPIYIPHLVTIYMEVVFSRNAQACTGSVFPMAFVVHSSVSRCVVPPTSACWGCPGRWRVDGRLAVVRSSNPWKGPGGQEEARMWQWEQS